MDFPENNGRYIADPYTAINSLLLTAMVIGELLLIWYALAVAGLLPPPPFLFPAVETVREQQSGLFVYALAAAGLSEFPALALVLRALPPLPGEDAARQLQRRMILRLTFAGAVWVYILVIWVYGAGRGV